VVLCLAILACGSPAAGPLDDGGDGAPGGDDGAAGAADGGEGGSPGDGGETPPVELTVDHFSSVGRAVLGALAAFPDERYRTWNYRGDAVFEPGWVLQTPPKEHWGQPASSLPLPAPCAGPGCDPDFGLQPCGHQGDCTGGGVCRPVSATVTRPGDPPRSLCVGHSDLLYERIYEALIETVAYADITNLSPCDVRFEAAIRNALTFLANRGAVARVRILFGNILGAEVDTASVLGSLTRDLDPGAPLTVHVGAYRQGLASWNHAKVVAVDDALLIEGGHNLWTAHYLTSSPIHDLSVRLRGTTAVDAHLFVNQLWATTCADHTFPNSSSRHSFPAGAPDCPPDYGWAPQPPLLTHTRVIAAARLGALGADPSDAAQLAMIAAAQSVVRLSLQDIGPVKIGPVTIGDWPQPLLGELGRALVRGVVVYVVLTNPGSVPGGLGGSGNTYGNGWTAGDTAAALEQWFDDHPGELPTGTTARDLICTRFHAALLRFSSEDTWPDGANIGNHAKFFIVDDLAFYVGSQNLYESDLAEFGLIVDDPAATAHALAEYWTPLWTQSRRTAVSGVEAPSCSY